MVSHDDAPFSLDSLTDLCMSVERVGISVLMSILVRSLFCWPMVDLAVSDSEIKSFQMRFYAIV